MATRTKLRRPVQPGWRRANADRAKSAMRASNTGSTRAERRRNICQSEIAPDESLMSASPSARAATARVMTRMARAVLFGDVMVWEA